jgi:hypothetical protein
MAVEDEASCASMVADMEVGLVVDAHAGVQALGLAVLHLNVATAPDATALYTLSLKVRTTSTLDTRFLISIT